MSDRVERIERAFREFMDNMDRGESPRWSRFCALKILDAGVAGAADTGAAMPLEVASRPDATSSSAEAAAGTPGNHRSPEAGGEAMPRPGSAYDLTIKLPGWKGSGT